MTIRLLEEPDESVLDYQRFRLSWSKSLMV